MPMASAALLLTSAIHPAFTVAEARRIPADLLADAFTDSPAAHRMAERDFRRQRMIEIEAARSSAARLAELAWA